MNDIPNEAAGDAVCEVHPLFSSNPLSLQNEETSSTMITEDSHGINAMNEDVNGDLNPSVVRPAGLPNGTEHHAADGGRSRERKRRKVAPSAPGGGKMPSHQTSISPPAPHPAPPDAPPAQIKMLSSVKGSAQVPLPPGIHATAVIKGGGQKKLSSYFPTLDQSSKDGLEQQPLQAATINPPSASHPQPLNPRMSITLPELNPPHPSHLEPGSKEMSLKLTHMDQQLQAKDRLIATLNERLSIVSDQLKMMEARDASRSQEIEDWKVNHERLKAQMEEMRVRGEEERKASMERETRLKNELSRGLRSSARFEREVNKMVIAQGTGRLGTIAVHRQGLGLGLGTPLGGGGGGGGLHEVWEDGQAQQALLQRLKQLSAQKEEVEAARKGLRKKLAPPPSSVSSSSAPPLSSSSSEASEGMPLNVEVLNMDEMYKLRLTAIKREEDQVRAEEERLNNEKLRHVKLLKRVRDEESSRFGGLGLLSKRYQMLNLLGKGGFSEVFKCYDLHEMRYVACKVHQLNPHWSDVKKQSYVKHAVREYEIHKSLSHPNIVGLLDIIEIDNSSFATILDLCEGPDLDSILREQGTLPEKEAKSIIAQVFRALVHLNQPRHKIIHYDLKPANVLFDSLGMVKVTDFGLSKIMEEGNTQLGGMELTSQGAGTYWYLPPECFELHGSQPPRISNKVDVWSAGVILFQMIYGKRPFGEGMTQEQIARERVIVLNAKDPIEFPSKPSASQEAKEFIRKCLTYKQEYRWDVMAAAADPYLCLTKAAASAALAAQQQQQQQQQGGGGAGGGSSSKKGAGSIGGFGGVLESMLVAPND